MIILIKTFMADILDFFGILNKCFLSLNKKHNNNYIRIINYHFTPESSKYNLIKQIDYYKNNFEIIDFNILKLFLKKKYVFKSKPGLLLTFDDGFKDNFDVANEVLKNNNIKGIYFISSGLIDKHKYMNTKQLETLIDEGNTIGNHTYSHHRFSIDDNHYILNKELIESNYQLNEKLNINSDLFCWVGGETETYIKTAFEVIKNNYKYVFCTCSQPVTNDTNPLYLQRTNIESSWSISLVKLQICGLWDYLYISKYNKIYSSLFK